MVANASSGERNLDILKSISGYDFDLAASDHERRAKKEIGNGFVWRLSWEGKIRSVKQLFWRH
jgi:hypothetical protein